jgi:hypothetical protein
MSANIDRIKNEQNLPITYSINIQTSSTPKRPLTCYITTTPRRSNQLNYIKPSICLEKSRSSIHLPVTYSTSIHVPCHPPMIKQRSPIILPSPSPHHHYYHYHHHYYYHHHHRQSLPSTTTKHKISPRPTSIASTRPATTSTTTITSPDSSSSPSKKPTKNMSTSLSSNKQSSHPPPLPSYSTLVWNWFHHTPTKTSSHHKGSQSDYSEVYRHELPSKRSLLFKLLTSPIEKPSKSKHHRPCFTRKRLESSSSLPNKSNHYNE